MEKLSDVLEYYYGQGGLLAILLRNHRDAIDEVDALMLPDGEYPSDDPDFKNLEGALWREEQAREALIEASQKLDAYRMAKHEAAEAEEAKAAA